MGKRKFQVKVEILTLSLSPAPFTTTTTTNTTSRTGVMNKSTKYIEEYVNGIVFYMVVWNEMTVVDEPNRFELTSFYELLHPAST